jgi:hypothetical protein
VTDELERILRELEEGRLTDSEYLNARASILMEDQLPDPKGKK